MVRKPPRVPPWQQDYEFLVKTEKRKSLIKNAGLGRFAAQFIPRGTVIAKLKIVNIYDSNMLYPMQVINIQSIPELIHLTSIFKMAFGCTDDEIFRYISNFACSVDGVNLFVGTSKGSFNHSKSKQNARPSIEHGYFVVRVTKDINANEEMYADYNEIKIPLLFQTFLSEKKFATINDLLRSKL
eukprot:375548_1